MIYKMTLKDSADEMTFDLLEVPIVDKDIEGAVDNVTLDGNQYTDYLWLKKQFIQKWSLLCDDEYTRLRGFYTRQFENADVPSYRLYYGDDIVRNFSESGEQITLSINGVTDGTISLTQVDGNTEQDGTPTPSAPVPVQTVTGRQTVTVTGKNLYDPNSTVFSIPANVSVEVEGNSVKVTALITTTSNNLYWRTPIPDSMLEDGKTYTISSVLGSGAYRSLRLLLRNHDGSNAGFSTGYSVTYDSRYTLFVVENPFATSGSTQVTAGTTCTISNIQVEEGATATTFEPYQGQSYDIDLGSIELCKIGTYQDRMYKENGNWYLHKEVGKVVLNGSENWSLINSGASNFYYNLPVFVTPKDQDIMPVSNYFIGTPITNGNTSVGLWITNAGTIRARKETEQTLAGYKTWLGTVLPSVYYVLATPTTTEITNEEVLEGLEALLNEAISVGLHNIYTDTPNALPTLTFDLTEYLSQSTTIIPETAVRLTLTDGGVINACGCRKDVQLTMRETIE